MDEDRCPACATFWVKCPCCSDFFCPDCGLPESEANDAWDKTEFDQGDFV